MRVKRDNPGGTPRTPRYARGQEGVVVAARGVTENPLDHAGVYPPLYTVAFPVRQVFGGDADGTLCVDLHEDWLEPAAPEPPPGPRPEAT